MDTFLSWPQPKKLEVPIASPWITAHERNYCEDALSNNWIGSNGSYNDLAEDRLSELLGQGSLTVSNGSVALILALRALGISTGDEVLVPDLTYAATASSVVNVGATPILCDIEPETWGISIASMRRMLTNRTKAIIVVHLYGVPARIFEIVEFAKQHNLKLIEDCAEAFDASAEENKVGTFGDVSTFSFFANKLITTGEGGAVSSRHQSIVENMKLLRGQGMSPDKRYYFEKAGYNFRMSNLHAAILFGQLERLDEIKSQRASVENEYRRMLNDVTSQTYDQKKISRSPWLFTTLLNNCDAKTKWKLAYRLAEKGIETRPVFYPLSKMPAFSEYPSDVNQVAQQVSEQGISLPTGYHITRKDVERICDLISKLLKG